MKFTVSLEDVGRLTVFVIIVLFNIWLKIYIYVSYIYILSYLNNNKD